MPQLQVLDPELRTPQPQLQQICIPRGSTPAISRSNREDDNRSFCPSSRGSSGVKELT